MSVEAPPKEETESAPPRQKATFVKHAAIYGIGTIATQAVSMLLLLPLYTNYLTVAAFGTLQLIYRIGEVLQTCLMSNGIRLATLNFWGSAKDKDAEARKTVAATVSFFVYASWLFTAIVMLALAKPISAYVGLSDDPWVLPVGVLVALLYGTTQMPLALMQARLESIPYVLATLALSLLQVAVAVVTVAWWGWSIWGVITALAVAYGLTGIATTAREIWLSREWRPNWPQMKQLIRFSAPFVPTGLFFFILAGGDQIFLAKIADMDSVGKYALGYRIATAVGLLVIAPLAQVWSAWMYTAYKQEQRSELFGQAITRIMMVYLAAATGLILLKTEILTLLSADDYLGATYVIAPIVAAQYFMTLANLMDASLYVTATTKRKPYIAAASAAFMVVVYMLIIPPFHARGSAELGAAYGTLIGLMGHCAFTWIGTRNVFAIRFEFARMLASIAVTVACCLVGNAFGDGLLLVPYKALVLLGWLAIMWFSGLISPLEKQLVWDTVNDARAKIGLT